MPDSLFFMYIIIIDMVGRVALGIATELRVGRSGDRIPVGRDFPPVQTGLGGPPSLLYNGYRVFSGGKVRPGRAADHSPTFNAAVMEV